MASVDLAEICACLAFVMVPRRKLLKGPKEGNTWKRGMLTVLKLICWKRACLLC